jgi:acetyl-CoA C-acetyltransferase
MNTREVVLCKPVRTAIGGFNGSLKGVPATDLGASVARETLRRSKLDADSIGSVVLGTSSRPATK